MNEERREDITEGLQSLRDRIQENKHCLGENVDKLEETENSRQQERHEVLFRAFNKVLATLKDVDLKLVDQIKTDAYDASRKLDKIEREVTKLMDLKKSNKASEVGIKATLDTLESKLTDVDVGSVSALCDVSLGYNEMELYTALQSTVFSVNGIFLKNAAFDPNMLQVNIVDSKKKQVLMLSNSDYAYFNVSSRPVKFSDFILRNLLVQVFAAKGPADNFVPILYTTALEMRKNNQIKIEGTNEITLKIARPPSCPTAVMCLSVSLFNTVLKGCPSFESSSSDLDQTDVRNLTTRVNRSMYSLDTTGRKFVASGFYLYNQSMSTSIPGAQATKQGKDLFPNTGSAMPKTDCNDSFTESAIPTAWNPVIESAIPAFDGNNSNVALASAMPIIGCNDSFPGAESAMPAIQCNDLFPAAESAMPAIQCNDSFPAAESAMPAVLSNDSFPAAESAMPAFQCNESFPAAESFFAIPAALPRLNDVMEQHSAPSTPPVYSVPNKDTDGGGLRRVPNLSDVREVTGEADVSVFSPHSDRGMVSTMRPTSMASMLDGALMEAQEVTKPADTFGFEDDMKGLVASTKGLSIEDMQKSLSSSEGSREEDVDLDECSEVQELTHNHSVSFAPKTKVFQELETPQPGQVQARFKVGQGNTKVKDGQAGVVRRLARQNQDDNDDLENPHLYLNASEAPSPTLADHPLPCDPAWNTGSGAVYEWAPPSIRNDRQPDESFATKFGLSDESRMDMSIWDINIPQSEDISEFNLALGLVELIDVYLPGDLEDKDCLQSPVHVAYAESFAKFLISEPEYNRIGVYSKRSASFQGWFGGSNENYNYPTSIVYLNNGCIALIERGRINVYDKDAKLKQNIVGHYYGLAVANCGDFITTQKTDDTKTHIVVMGQVNERGNYVIKEKVTISIIADKAKSKVRFLAVCGNKIYASDYGLNLIYVVDMVTKSQACWVKECQAPCGMLVDDVGNVLVADSGNNRLAVFNSDGELLRQLGSSVPGASSPHDVVKMRGKGKDGAEEDHIVVTYSGTDGTDGRLVRFKCS